MGDWVGGYRLAMTAPYPDDLPEPAHDHPAGKGDDDQHTTADPSSTPPASDEPADALGGSEPGHTLPPGTLENSRLPTETLEAEEPAGEPDPDE
jgi:hypothetical protein